MRAALSGRYIRPCPDPSFLQHSSTSVTPNASKSVYRKLRIQILYLVAVLTGRNAIPHDANETAVKTAIGVVKCACEHKRKLYGHENDEVFEHER